MKTNEKTYPLSYILKTYRMDQLILPASLWGLFAILVVIFQGQDSAYQSARAFIGIVLPMIAGILAAYAVLEDPALELQFSMPVPPWRMLAERLSLVFAVIAVCALTFQVYLGLIGLSLSPLGSVAARQLAWLVPTLNLMGLGCVVGLAGAKPVPGAMTVGLVWLFQLIGYSWFVHNAVGRYFYLYMGTTHAELPQLRANQLVLTFFAIVYLVSAWALMRKQERYL